MAVVRWKQRLAVCSLAWGLVACNGAPGVPETPENGTPSPVVAPPAIGAPPTSPEVAPPPPATQRSVLFRYLASAVDAQLDATGNLVLTGYSGGEAHFGSATVPDTGTCANDFPYGSDLQVTRLRLDGTLLSSWTLPGCFGRHKMTLDADGSIWVESATMVRDGYGYSESTPFLARLSADGQVLWSRRHPDATGRYELQPARVRPGMWGRRAVQVDPEGNPGLFHVQLVRLTPDGEVEQAHDLGALGWLTTQVSVDGRGYVTVAGELSEGGQRLLSIERWTPDGERQWIRRFPVAGLGGAAGHADPVALASAPDGSAILLFNHHGDIQLGDRQWRYTTSGTSALPLLVKLDGAGTVLWSAASSDSASWAKLGVDDAGRPVVTGPRFFLSEPPSPPFQSFTHLSAFDAKTGQPLYVEKLAASIGRVVTSPTGSALVVGGLYLGGTLGDGDSTPGGFVLELSLQQSPPTVGR